MAGSNRVGRKVLATAIIFMASADGTISAEAWGQLRSVIGSDEDVLETALVLSLAVLVVKFSSRYPPGDE